MNKKINYNDIVINMLQITNILQSFIIYLCFAWRSSWPGVHSRARPTSLVQNHPWDDRCQFDKTIRPSHANLVYATVSQCCLREWTFISGSVAHNAQYTPPTPTRLNCRLNSQLAHDDCRRKFGNWTWWEFILSSWVELSCVGGVYAPVGCRDPVYNNAANGVGLEIAGSRLATAASWLRSHRQHDATRLRCRQIVQTRRDCRQLVANSIHTADATQLDSWVASAVCIRLNCHVEMQEYRRWDSQRVQRTALPPGGDDVHLAASISLPSQAALALCRPSVGRQADHNKCTDKIILEIETIKF